MDSPAPDLPEALIAHHLAGRSDRRLLHLTTTTARLRAIAAALAVFRPDLQVLVLPPWDCLPYDRRSPGGRRAGQPAAALARLPALDGAGDDRPVALLTTAAAALQRLP
ncbi:hypothetical protein, partial [Caenispirillum bisanense]|uniref:hypothetical protein n=1 Tax=Caenispirillum bisanense TaxID=414052 RepID=UPI0031DE7113